MLAGPMFVLAHFHRHHHGPNGLTAVLRAN
jgi:hypothetical protein